MNFSYQLTIILSPSMLGIFSALDRVQTRALEQIQQCSPVRTSSEGLSANSGSCGTLGTSSIFDSPKVFFRWAKSHANIESDMFPTGKNARKKIRDNIKKYSSFYCSIDLLAINSTFSCCSITSIPDHKSLTT